MVVQLPDHLPELLSAIVPECLAVHKSLVGVATGSYKGNLRPGHDTCLVEQSVHLRSMRIVTEPDGVGPHLPDDGHILPVVGIGERIAYLRAVLMAAHPVQGQVTAVEEESLLRIYAEEA